VDLTIDVRAKRPSYLQLADRLRAAIESGELAANDQIPSLHQLAGQTGLAVSTVQKAIRALELDNLIYTVAGRGAFVTPRNITREG
jgi:GntR family transcriptional regulator